MPSTLTEVVGRLLAKDPDDRNQTAEGLRGDLLRIAGGDHAVFPLAVSAGATVEDALVGRKEQVVALARRWRRAADGQGR